MTIIAVGVAIIPKLDQKLYEENRKIFDDLITFIIFIYFEN